MKNVEKHLEKHGKQLRRGLNSPMSNKYRPECNVIPELSREDASYYMSLIGILRWTVELGRVDIACEVSMLSSYVANPREGHLEQMYHIFAYLKRHHNSRIVIDPSYPEVDEEAFQKYDWNNFFGEVKEQVPSNSPRPLGKEFIMRAFVGASHTCDRLNRRSRTGFIIFLNSAPVHWHTKKQGGVETSTFGS